MKSTYERLEQMEKRINQDGFTQPKGIGSDIPHFVLDYPAKDELQVRVYVKNMLKRTPLKIKEVNLFEFLLKFRSKKSDIIPYKIKPETDFFIKKCKKDTHFLVKLR